MSETVFTPIPDNFGEHPLDVFPGQLICARAKPRSGKPGRTITGEDIPARDGEDVGVIPGRNVCVSEDGTRFFAMDFGRIVWEKAKINVEKILIVPENVTDSIEFPGSIEINGSISDNASITTAGDITVKGGIGAAEINAGGNITVGQDIAKSKIVCEGNISANAMKEAEVTAAGTITIGDAITKSIVTAGSIIAHTARKGVILGGETTVKKLLTAKKIGEENASLTTNITLSPGAKAYVELVYPKSNILLGKRSVSPKKAAKKAFYQVEPSGSVVMKTYEEIVVEEEAVSYENINAPILPVDMPLAVAIEGIALLEEAKKMGAEMLQLSIDGVDAHLDRPGKIIVFKKGVVGPWFPDKWDELYGPITDGSFDFENRGDGLYLAVIFSQGAGKKVNSQDIIEDAISQKFNDIDTSKIEEIFRKRIKKPVRIGPRQYLRGKIEVNISEDQLTATVNIIPPKMGGMLMSVEDIVRALNEKNVTFGIDKDRLVNILHLAEFNVPMAVAHGNSPLTGENAYLAYQYGEKGDGNVLIGEDAIPGQVIGVKIPPTIGASGIAVSGETLHGLYGKNIKLIAEKNVFVDGNSCFSAAFGKVVWQGFRATVEQIYRVEDADANIETAGKVVVHGNVKEGVKITAGGDVIIHGAVENNAEITNKGTLSIEGEVSKAKIQTMLDISATVIKDSQIECGGTLNVSDGLLDSQVNAENVILSADGKGLIVGGEVFAKNMIHAKVIGKEDGSSPTTIKVGENGVLAVLGVLHPKVNLVFGKRSLTTKKPAKKVTFKIEKGAMTTQAYEPPNISPLKPLLVPITASQCTAPRSIIVHGYSVDEAKQKAAELLYMTQEELDGDILPKEKSKTAAVRVYPKGVYGPWLDNWDASYMEESVEENEDTSNLNANGSFGLINKREGLFLRLKAPRGTGKPITSEQVLAEIERRGYIDIDSQRVVEACANLPGDQVRIGLMQFTTEFGGKFEITISDDKHEVFMTITPPATGMVLIKPENVIHKLEKKGVVAGIMEDEIARILKEKDFGRPVLIATSIPPSKGEAGRFVYRLGGE
ncbi:MAG: FapA family protein [bacterium]|nr:FapA family protein [bacterium]